MSDNSLILKYDDIIANPTEYSHYHHHSQGLIDIYLSTGHNVVISYYDDTKVTIHKEFLGGCEALIFEDNDYKDIIIPSNVTLSPKFKSGNVLFYRHEMMTIFSIVTSLFNDGCMFTPIELPSTVIKTLIVIGAGGFIEAVSDSTILMRKMLNTTMENISENANMMMNNISVNAREGGLKTSRTLLIKGLIESNKLECLKLLTNASRNNWIDMFTSDPKLNQYLVYLINNTKKKDINSIIDDYSL